MPLTPLLYIILGELQFMTHLWHVILPNIVWLLGTCHGDAGESFLVLLCIIHQWPSSVFYLSFSEENLDKNQLQRESDHEFWVDWVVLSKHRCSLESIWAQCIADKSPFGFKPEAIHLFNIFDFYGFLLKNFSCINDTLNVCYVFLPQTHLSFRFQ